MVIFVGLVISLIYVKPNNKKCDSTKYVLKFFLAKFHKNLSQKTKLDGILFEIEVLTKKITRRIKARTDIQFSSFTLKQLQIYEMEENLFLKIIYKTFQQLWFVGV